MARPTSIAAGEPTALMMLTSIDRLASALSRAGARGMCTAASLSALVLNFAAPSALGGGSLAERAWSSGGLGRLMIVGCSGVPADAGGEGATAGAAGGGTLAVWSGGADG